MTPAQFNKKIAELLKNGQFEKSIKKEARRLANDPYFYNRHIKNADDDFIIPKCFMAAFLEQLAWQYEPISKDFKKQYKDMKPSIKTS